LADVGVSSAKKKRQQNGGLRRLKRKRGERRILGERMGYRREKRGMSCSVEKRAWTTKTGRRKMMATLCTRSRSRSLRLRDQ